MYFIIDFDALNEMLPPLRIRLMQLVNCYNNGTNTDSKNYKDLTKVKYSNQNQEKNMSKHIKNEDKNEDNKEKNAIINDNITVIIEQHKTNELLLQCNTISQYN